MKNNTLNSVLEEYAKEAGVDECKKLLYGNDGLIKKYEDPLDIDTETVNLAEADDDTRNNIISLGIKKGFIWINKNEINFIQIQKNEDSFYQFAKSVIGDSRNVIREKVIYNPILDYTGPCVTNYINWALDVVASGSSEQLLAFLRDINKINIIDSDFQKYLLVHYREIAPCLHKYYCQLLAYTLFYKADIEEYNIFSRTVRKYFESDPVQKEKFLKLYIESYVRIRSEKTNTIDMGEISSVFNNLKNEEGNITLEDINSLGGTELNEIEKGLNLKRICFNYQDFIRINNDKLIKQIFDDLMNNDVYKRTDKIDYQLTLDDIRSTIEIQKILYDFENYEGAVNTISVNDDNIDELR